MTDPLKKNHIALKFDFENAFNSISRTAIRKEVKTHFPELLPWYDTCYDKPAHLFCQHKMLGNGPAKSG